MAVLDKLHRYVEGISVDVFKPAEEANEQIWMLEIY